MSFSTQSSFSTDYQTLGSVLSLRLQVQPASSLARVCADTGGLDCWWPRGLAAGMAGSLACTGRVQSEEETIQCLIDCLASYLKRVKSLEADNQRRERKIQEDWRKGDLRSETGGIPSRPSRTWGLRSSQALWTVLSLTCRLVMTILLLVTSESSMKQSWARTSLWRVASVSSRRSWMTLILPAVAGDKDQSSQGGTALCKEEPQGGSKCSMKPDCQLWVDHGVGCPQISGSWQDHGRHLGLVVSSTRRFGEGCYSEGNFAFFSILLPTKPCLCVCSFINS